MQAYRKEIVLTENGTLVITNLPFQAGEAVEVIILAKTPASSRNNPYPLRGKPVTYVEPTEPVADSDWEILE